MTSFPENAEILLENNIEHVPEVLKLEERSGCLYHWIFPLEIERFCNLDDSVDICTLKCQPESYNFTYLPSFCKLQVYIKNVVLRLFRFLRSISKKVK